MGDQSSCGVGVDYNYMSSLTFAEEPSEVDGCCPTETGYCCTGPCACVNEEAFLQN
jgi:hypothetical protein